MNNSKPQLVIIFITILLYLVGFGVVIPILPVLSRSLGASATQTGILLSVYSIMQFIFSPYWGRISESLGRRPILLFCLLGEGISYLLFAWSRSLEWLFVSRVLAGFFGASISTASAYISDVSQKQDRSKSMALIGVAFGLGFVIGPALGAGLTMLGRSLDSQPFFDTTFAFCVVAGLCFINFLLAFWFLKESKTKKNKTSQTTKRFSLIWHFITQKTVGPLMLLILISSIALSSIEANLILFLSETLKWDVKQIAIGFAYIGTVTVLTQGFLVRKILPLFGEPKVLGLGVMLLAFGLTGVSFATTTFGLGFTLTLLAMGNGMANPSTMGSISLLTSESEQGPAMGVAQSMASLGRTVGPAIGGILYQYFSPTSPFWSAGILAFCGLAMVAFIFDSIPDHAKSRP